jgi:hypothetical protein
MMNYNVYLHPALKHAIEATMELEKARLKLQTVLGKETFEKVKNIIENEEAGKRAAFYETITEAACYGSDFSKVETIKDIADIYARFIIKRAFGE